MTPAQPRSWPVLLGIVLVLVAFLLLTTTPGILYRFLHRSHYRTVEVEVLSIGAPRSITVKVKPSGETLRIRSSTFEGTKTPGAVFPASHDPDARLTLGAGVFDERIVSAEPYHGLPAVTEVLVLTALQLASALGGFLLLRRASVPS